MAGFRNLLLLHLLIVVFALGLTEAAETEGDGDEGQVYIVYMGHLSVESGTSEADGGLSAVQVAHHNMLEQVLDGSLASDRIIHSYKRSLNGFAARLTEQEAQTLYTNDGVVSVFPSRTHQLLTTRSWDLLGFP
uniref:Inhibitor I9 domain-containing protein n=1 Tax=Leersia perrieri TaxID=77586 RepID=A0A0D9WWF0_9ORYZ